MVKDRKTFDEIYMKGITRFGGLPKLEYVKAMEKKLKKMSPEDREDLVQKRRKTFGMD